MLIHFVPAFPLGRSRGQQPQVDPKYFAINSNFRKFPSVHTKTGPSKVEDVVTPPGAWTTSRLLSRRCSQQDLPHSSFLGDSGHMARPTQLGSFHSEKWLDIPGFTDFKPVRFVTKCQTLISSQKSHLCRLFLGKYSFSRYSRFMSTDEDRNKDRFKN